MVLKSHSGSWDLSPAPSWHQNLLDKSWRGQAKVIAATALLIVHPSRAAAEGMNYNQLLLTPSHCSGWRGEQYSHLERAGRRRQEQQKSRQRCPSSGIAASEPSLSSGY